MNRKGLLIVLTLLVSCTVNAQKAETIDNAQLVMFLEDDNIQLLDVRTPEEVAKGIIKGATVINFYDKDFEEQVSKLDKDVPLVVYCAAGGRSAKTGVKLSKLGFKTVYDLTGGFTLWQKEGFPVAKQ